MSQFLLACRAIVAVLIFYVVTQSLIGTTQSRLSLDAIPFTLSAIVFHGLLTIAGIWLIFGLRTRIMASFATAYLSAYVGLLLSNVELDPVVTYSPFIALIFSTPLILFGGGELCIQRRTNWHHTA